MIRLVFVGLLFLALNGVSQNVLPVRAISIDFAPETNDQEMVLVEKEDLEAGRLQLTTLRLYLSHIELISAGEVVFQDESTGRLIDCSVKESMSFSLELPWDIEVDSIRFMLGIDSVTNVCGALDGDLDPTKGMYWTWQSGYINVKMQGVYETGPSFEYHLGGYMNPNLAARVVTLAIGDDEGVRLVLNLDQFIHESKDDSSLKIMSPGSEAAEMSRLVAKSFYIK